jgi:hypothetical protein
MNADRVLATCHPGYSRIQRVVETNSTPESLVELLKSKSIKHDRFRQEAYIVAYEADPKRRGLPERWLNVQHELRRFNYGLDVESELFYIWEQCVAEFQSQPITTIPESVRLIVCGPTSNRGEPLLHGAAVLLEDEVIYRRRDKYPADKFPDLNHRVVRGWAQAAGALQQDLDAIEKMIARDADHQLQQEPAEPYASLDPSCVELARDLVRRSGHGDDARLAYYVFRSLQRIAAYEHGGKTIWYAEWLRGEGAHPRAIPGATKSGPILSQILEQHVFGEKKGHSGGGRGMPTTYTLRIAIAKGSVDHVEAARNLGLELNSKGVPRKG